ncbi:POTRA domain-containing protein, partial [uncultured Acidaminococcus sp.]
MKKTAYLSVALGLLVAGPVYAQSPLPTFDKEAVTEYPYNRRGEQQVITKDPTLDEVKVGNTGTEADPAFYVKKITLTGFSLPNKDGALTRLLASYEKKNLKVSDLSKLTDAITTYAKNSGYPVAATVVPPQEVRRGELELKVYVARYDRVALTKNQSDVADQVLDGYLHRLKEGEPLKDRTLERVMNDINDLPGVTARGILRPGSLPGT